MQPLRRSANDGLMLGQRRRRWVNLIPELGQHIVLAAWEDKRDKGPLHAYHLCQLSLVMRSPTIHHNIYFDIELLLIVRYLISS